MKLKDINNEEAQKYIYEQLITYLGNKRQLIDFIDSTVSEIINNDEELKNKKEIKFFDIFAGSGVVSRYGKAKGFKVYSNDLELYSSVINDVYINTNKDELENIFKPVVKNLLKKGYIKKEEIINNDSYQTVLNYLNNLKQVRNEKNKYFQIHYAPKDTNNPDFEKERLFYTQENARKIDAILEAINDPEIFDVVEPIHLKVNKLEDIVKDKWFEKKFKKEKAKNIILASLLYKMTVNINTSGTMKGFHKGWGGTGKHALNRILGEIKLEKINFINGLKGKVFNDYAEKVFENNNLEKVDIIYADPPYNSHQYSANYHLLNTACLNDRYNPGPVKKGSRAGIRTDHNRSDFSKATKKESKKLAEIAFEKFINNIKTKYLIMSYNNEGLVDIKRLLNILSNNFNNKISIKFKLYDKFKGGKATQSSNKVLEYLIIVEMNKKQKPDEFQKVLDEIELKSIKNIFLDKYIDIDKLINENQEFSRYNNQLIYNSEPVLEFNDLYKIIKENINSNNKNIVSIIKNYEMNKPDRIKKYITILKENKNKEKFDLYYDEAYNLLKYLKIKKYQDLKKELEKELQLLKVNIDD